MTGIVLRGFEKNNFSVREFYLKRVKRIIPALLFVSIIVLIFSAFFFFSYDIQSNSRNTLVTIAFVSNIFYWLNSGYFDPDSQNNIFLHSWSLSVEWQFYMLYPILLLLVRKFYLRSKRIFNSILALFTLASFVLCVIMSHIDQDFAFYMFPTRAWEMTLGGLAWTMSGLVAKTFGKKLLSALAILAYMVILLCNSLLDESIVWPGGYTAIPTIATFIILVSNIEFRVIKWRVFQFFGDISYSLYLWHWPVFIAFKYYGYLDGVSIVWMTISSILLAVVSYYFVEKNKKIASPKFVFVSIVPIALIGLLLFKYPNNAFISNYKVYSDELNTIGNFSYNYKQFARLEQFNPCNCFLTSNKEYQYYDESKCFTIDTNKINVLLLGDSHAAQFSKSFRTKLPEHYNVLEVSAGFILPFEGAQGRKESEVLINKFYSELLPKNSDHIDKVLISVHWILNSKNGKNISLSQLKDEILKTIDLFESKGIDVIFIGQSESYIIEFPRVVFIHLFGGKPYSEFIDPKSQQINDYLKSFIPAEKYIDIYELPSISKYDAKNQMPYMIDKNHYSIFGADQVVDYILENYLVKKQ